MILNDSKFQVFPTYQEFGIHVFNTYIRLHPEDRQVLKNTYRLFFSWKSIYQRRRNIRIQRYRYTWSRKYGG